MRIGINVPDKVVKLIKELDPDANISQICREALSSHTAALERARVEIADEDMDEIIEHLMQSETYPHIEPDWAGFAWQDARDWVATIKPRYWHHFLDRYDHHKGNSRELYLHADFCREKEVKRLTDRMLENDDWFWGQAVMGGNAARQKAYEKAENEYRQTFLAYVNEVRRKCLSYRAGKNGNLLAARETEWTARPEPELPPQLLS